MLLSRVAESLYWAARYLERAEDTARIVRSYSEAMVDLPVSVSTSWEPLLAITGSREAFDALHDQTDEASIVQFLVADAGNPGSVVSCVTQARENLRSTREILPRDGWLVVNDTLPVRRVAPPRRRRPPQPGPVPRPHRGRRAGGSTASSRRP